jgi:uncharacterized protein YjbI with pentapeptide repeats
LYARTRPGIEREGGMPEVNPRDLDALQKAVNDAAGKSALLWTTFITLCTYLLIASGSIKHRDLFLGTSVKLPILGVDLPVTGYFTVAPIVLVVFHFHLVIQLRNLGEKFRAFYAQLSTTSMIAADRRLLLQRFDGFPVLQALTRFASQEPGIDKILLVLVAWITIAAVPLVICLQQLVVFLPYHSAEITWLHRAMIMVDLAVIWLFWTSVRATSENSWGSRLLGRISLGICTAVTAIFAVLLAAYPGEYIYRNPAARGLDYVAAGLIDEPLSRLLFEGDIDAASGEPASLFSNRIILPGGHFFDPEKHAKADFSVSLRGRDLRSAVFTLTDLRKADFTGANLLEASFSEAKLQGTAFGCPSAIKIGSDNKIKKGFDPETCTDLRGADFTDAELQGAVFEDARLLGATFKRALMQGASLNGADLTAATFSGAHLEGANLHDVKARGVSFFDVQAQGADFSGADLTAASFLTTQLQAASFKSANTSYAVFRSANLYRAYFDSEDIKKGTWLAGASLFMASASDRFPRLRRTPFKIDPTEPDKLDGRGYEALLKRTIAGLPDGIAEQIKVRVKTLDPQTPLHDDQLVFSDSKTTDEEERKIKSEERYQLIKEVMCDAENAPFIARGFIQNGRILSAETDGVHLGEWLRQPEQCPGAEGLTESDLKDLRRIERTAKPVAESTDDTPQ